MSLPAASIEILSAENGLNSKLPAANDSPKDNVDKAKYNVCKI